MFSELECVFHSVHTRWRGVPCDHFLDLFKLVHLGIPSLISPYSEPLTMQGPPSPAPPDMFKLGPHHIGPHPLTIVQFVHLDLTVQGPPILNPSSHPQDWLKRGWLTFDRKAFLSVLLSRVVRNTISLLCWYTYQEMRYGLWLVFAVFVFVWNNSTLQFGGSSLQISFVQFKINYFMHHYPQPRKWCLHWGLGYNDFFFKIQMSAPSNGKNTVMF